MAGVELDHTLLCPLNAGVTVIGEVDRLLEGVCLDLGGVVDVRVDAAENGEGGHSVIQNRSVAERATLGYQPAVGSLAFGS